MSAVKTRPPRSIYPRGLERDYANRLKRRLRSAARACKRVLDQPGEEVRLDSEASNEDTVRNAIGRVRVAYFERYTVIEDYELAVEAAGRVEGYIERQVARQVKSVLGVDPLPTQKRKAEADLFVEENVALITSIGAEFFDKLEADIVEALAGGARWEQLAGVIKSRYGVSARRANLIARDQMGSLNAKLNQAKLQDVGVERYIWRNSQDERVVGNPSGKYPTGNDVHGNHWKREGVAFRWDRAPHDGHPGEAINCRCTAEPLWDDLEDNSDVPEAGEEELTLAKSGDVGSAPKLSQEEIEEMFGPAPVTHQVARPVEKARASGKFNEREMSIIEDVQTMIDAGLLRDLDAAWQANEEREFKVAGYTVIYVPEAPSSGMTLFGDRGFIVGQEAFVDGVDGPNLTKTLIHETQRLDSSVAIETGFSNELVAKETKDAFDFADTAYSIAFEPEEVD